MDGTGHFRYQSENVSVRQLSFLCFLIDQVFVIRKQNHQFELQAQKDEDNNYITPLYL